jgi:hypothetical protein
MARRIPNDVAPASPIGISRVINAWTDDDAFTQPNSEEKKMKEARIKGNLVSLCQPMPQTQ